MARSSTSRRGIVLGLAAAVSFGVSAPFAKRLLDDVSPQMLAGVLYVGAFIGLTSSGAVRMSRRDSIAPTLHA